MSNQKLPIVAIIGQTNAGKSALFNRMVGRQDAIVAREAGTTRDSVSRVVRISDAKDFGPRDRFYGHQKKVVNSGQSEAKQTSLGKAGLAPNRQTVDAEAKRGGNGLDEGMFGSPENENPLHKEDSSAGAQNDTNKENAEKERAFLLVDTAGLKNPEDDFEATIQDQIDDAVDSADLILLVKDISQPFQQSDRDIAKKALKSKKPVFLILNKTDLKEKLPRDEFLRLGIKDIFETSAEHNRGVSQLLTNIAKNIPVAKTEKTDDDLLKIALIGRPNVGKSHLFNTMSKKQQAIVADVAGTTRDINRVKVKYMGRPLELLDTAGVRKPGKIEQGIEKFSVLRTTAAIEEADICLLLTPADELNTALDQKLAGLISDAGKGMILVVSKWDLAGEEFAAERILAKMRAIYDFVPWASVIFTSSETGKNVAKIFDLALEIDKERKREIPTRKLNDLLQKAVAKHPPAGLKNTHPKFRYAVQTDTAPPWFVIYGSNFKFIHWSYKRYIERQWRESFGFSGTPIKFSFRDEKQIKANRENSDR